MSGIPDRTEAAEYYFKYIEQAGDGDIRTVLRAQVPDTLALLHGISDADSLTRYAPDKWSLRQVLSHLNDTERVFVFRAFWFARGFEGPLPSFNQTVAVEAAGADDRTWGDLIDEFAAVRAATLTFFDSLTPDDWSKSGTASGHPVTVRALAYITAGHLTHHLTILRERYLR